MPAMPAVPRSVAQDHSAPPAPSRAAMPVVAAGDPWRSLYRVGAVAALLVVAFIPVQAAVFAIWPPPDTVAGWFTLFQDNPLAGLLDLDLLMIVDYVLLAALFVALWAALRGVSPSYTALAVVLQLLATATYFASTVAFEMLSLSNQFADAATDAERSETLAAGRMLLATWQGTAFDVAYILSAAAMLTLSALMLRGTVFGRRIAALGLAAGALMIVPPTAGTFGIVLSFLSLLPLVVWLVLVARTLLRLAMRPS